MARLPQPGGDAGHWGEILNEFLSESLTADGSLKAGTVDNSQLRLGAVSTASIADDAVDETKLSDAVRTKLNELAPIEDGSITAAMLSDDAVTAPKIAGLVVGESHLADASVSALKLQDGSVSRSKIIDAGAADGIASLDANGRLPEAQIPARLGSAELSSSVREIGDARYLSLGAAEADAIFDSVHGIRADWHHTPVITVSSTASIPTPAVHYPAIVNAGSKKADWNGLTDPIDPKFLWTRGHFETSNGGSGDLEMHGLLIPGGASQAAFWPMTTEFICSATAQVEIELWAPSGSTDLSIEIDGRQVANLAAIPGGGLTYVLLTFPTSLSRNIRLSSGYFRFRAVRLPSGGTITKPAYSNRRIGVGLGDSWGGGAGTGSGVGTPGGAGRTSTYMQQLLRACGAAEAVNMSVGGSGLINGGSTSAYYTRAAAAVEQNPSFLIIQASQNDWGQSAAAVRAAVFDLLDRTSTISECYFLTPFWADAAGTAAQAYRDAIASAVLEYGQGVRLIDVSAAVGGAGNYLVGGRGTRGLFLGSDNAHISAAGHRYIARRAFRAIAPYIYS